MKSRKPKAESRRPNWLLKAVTVNRLCSDFGVRISFPLALILSLAFSFPALAASPSLLFRAGVDAFRSGDYTNAATAFWQSATAQPASGSLQNLGLAQWQCGRTGPAILAWEQALWLDPLNDAARVNLRFARKAAQLETPELAWYEVVSTWLPAGYWAWVAGASLWLAVGLVMVPGILRWRRAAWHQAAAALGLAVFLLSLPALLGVQTRANLGFVLEKNVPLRLTPTEEAQFITRLAPGEPIRAQRTHGDYVLVRTSRGAGWLTCDQFGLTCPKG
jgi:hypothetical protein